MNRRALLASPISSLDTSREGGDKGPTTATKPKKSGPRAKYFPNVVLRTHENKEVRFYDDLIHDKVVVINMMYADCEGVCPAMTRNLVKVQELLGDRVGRDIFMYSITLKPEKDTPGALKEYARMHGVKPGWLFLTGKPADIELLRRKLGFVDPDPALDKDTSQHIGVVRIGNEWLDSWSATPVLRQPRDIVQSILWMAVPRPRNGSRQEAKPRGEPKK
ncbi:MAG TPA: SCO family protein [Blastocatellia bacterium]|nr:SCO family protein [Blastocatellia bacterium]